MTLALLAVVTLVVAWQLRAQAQQAADADARAVGQSEALREMADRLADVERRCDDLTERAVHRGLDLDAVASTVLTHGQALTDLRGAITAPAPANRRRRG